MARTRSNTHIPELLRQHQQALLADWITRQLASGGTRRDLINEAELQRQSRDFLTSFTKAAEYGFDDIHGAHWTPVRDVLTGISRSRALQGFSATETATFVFSLKQPLFTQLRQSIS